MEKNAIASVITDETLGLDYFDDLKAGDSKITILYLNEKNNRGNNVVGEITCYSNGEIYLNINNSKYEDEIYNDYLKINGDNKEPKPKGGLYKMPLLSNNHDKKRWTRLKQFVFDNNIELDYSEDIKETMREYYNETNNDYPVIKMKHF